MKKTLKFMAVAAALVLAATVFAACGGKTEGGSASGASSAASAAASSAESKAESTAENKTADLSNPDITINNGDYDAMKTFASEMQGKTHEGKVVRVTGISTRSNFGAKASIMESDGGTQKIGATYKLTGVDSIDGYPADDAVVELTGVVKVDDNGISCYIEVAPENLKTVS